MEKLNIELLMRALRCRKKELLILRGQYETELINISCGSNKKNYEKEYYESIKYTIDNMTDELIDIVEELDKLESLK